MNVFVIIIVVVVAIVLFAVFNPTTKRIREIQTLLNKDRTVCDYIDSLYGWSVDNVSSEGLRIVISPGYMPMYYLYITYNGERPSNKQIKQLHTSLFSPYFSPVVKAHNLNMPYEEYAQWEEDNSRLCPYILEQIERQEREKEQS